MNESNTSEKQQSHTSSVSAGFPWMFSWAWMSFWFLKLRPDTKPKSRIWVHAMSGFISFHLLIPGAKGFFHMLGRHQIPSGSIKLRSQGWVESSILWPPNCLSLWRSTTQWMRAPWIASCFFWGPWWLEVLASHFLGLKMGTENCRLVNIETYLHGNDYCLWLLFHHQHFEVPYFQSNPQVNP